VKHGNISWRKITEVNDLSPHVMMDEWSRFTSEVWDLGVSNFNHEDLLEENRRSEVASDVV
jgi:hypothetical protein